MDEKNEVMTVDNIQKRVYFIRGQQVMLDFDLAEIYGYEVKRLNEQVKRNIARFPDDFMFQLTMDEVPEDFRLKSQIATLNENGNKRGLHIKKLPYAFTEQGIYMLATVLRGELAEQQSIFIMRAFREMRHYIKQNQQFVTQSDMGLLTSKVSDIAVQVAGYPPLHIKPNPDCHDRLIVIDYKLPTEQVYHCGASSKDAGKKLCAINKIENSRIVYPVIDNLLTAPDKII